MPLGACPWVPDTNLSTYASRGAKVPGVPRCLTPTGAKVPDTNLSTYSMVAYPRVSEAALAK